MYRTGLLLSLGMTMSLGVFGYQQPDSSQTPSQNQTQPKKGKAGGTSGSPSDTGSRSRVGEPSGSMVAPVDEKFMMEAARDGMLEVQLGQIAQQKASSQAVKDFGKRMEQDHTQANKELADIAKARNVSLPTDLGNEKKTVDRLSSRTGAEFDKDYMRSAVSQHRKAIREFEREEKGGMDSDLKAFVTKTLPTLREHLRMAEETEKGLSGKKASSPGATDTTQPDTQSNPGKMKKQ
jgi:putative membrane protein